MIAVWQVELGGLEMEGILSVHDVFYHEITKKKESINDET